AGDMSQIRGPALSIKAETPTRLALNDSKASTNHVGDRAVTIERSSLTFGDNVVKNLAPADIYFGPGITVATIVGSKGTDEFKIEGTATGAALEIDTGAGQNTITVTPTSQNPKILGGNLYVKGGGDQTDVMIDGQKAPPDLDTFTPGMVNKKDPFTLQY